MAHHINRARWIPLLCIGLLLLGPAESAVAQADWSAKVLKQRKPEDKERVTFQNAQRQGVPDQTLITLAERERHSPVVACAAGQYFEKMKRVPDSFFAIQSAMKRRDVGDKVAGFGVMSPVAKDLITALAESRTELDRQAAARMIAALAMMRRGKSFAEQADAKPVNPALKPPAWLVEDYSDQLKVLVESSKSRDTLECALLAAGLDSVEAMREAALEFQTHRVPEVAGAARFAVARLGGEVDVEKLIADLQPTDRQRAKDPLSYDPRQSPLVYAIMTAGQAEASETVDLLIGYLNDKDVHVGVAAARSLGMIGGDGLAVRMLGEVNDQTLWPVRVALYDAVGANPDAKAVELLLKRFDAETGRLRQDVLYALLSIAAEGVDDPSIEGVRAWWQANADGFKADPAATESWRTAHRVGEIDVPAFAGFYETAVISDRLVFAIDASKSIDANQLALLESTLTDVFGLIPESSKFNLVDFGGHIRVLGKGRMLSGKLSVRGLDVFLKQTELTFGTRIFEAIETSMELPEVDSVHFLSDGAPFGSQINDWRRVHYLTRLRTATVPIALNIVFLPRKGDPKKIAKWPLAIQMREFAEDHAGRFQVMVPEAN